VPKPTIRPVLYPRVSVAVCASPDKSGVDESVRTYLISSLGRGEGQCAGLVSYNPPLTHIDARTLLDWQVEEEGGEKFGDDYLLLDRTGRKVRCTKNVRNRPLVMSLVEDRVQDILNARWELNGETVIISREGDVLDGQHTLVAVVLAYEDWLTEQETTQGERKWVSVWPDEEHPDGPSIDKIIVYGISSSDRVVNTMNTGKPRSLADVLYRSPYFASLPARAKTNVDRVTAGKVTSSAIGSVWVRTGMYHHGFGSRRTTAEAVAWLESHGGKSGKLLAAVRHVLESNTDGKISDLVTLGSAATYLFLMASSATEDKQVGKYYAADERSSKRLDFSLWEKAEEFWTEFGKTKEDVDDAGFKVTTGKLKELTFSLRALTAASTNPADTAKEKDYVICRAWERFSKGKSVRFEDVQCKYTDPDPRTGARKLATTPSVGGIDLGTEKVPVSDDEGLAPHLDTETEVENGKHEAEQTHGKPHRSNTPVTGIAADGIEHLVQLVRDAEGVDAVFTRTPSSKNWTVWGDGCDVVTAYVTKSPKPHPRGLRHLSFRQDETEVLLDHLTDAGLSVALVVEAVAPVNGDPKYAMETVARPKGVR
jgi:hypothetical protein